jgi:uncharacterized RDD family membrane protein YckC
VGFWPRVGASIIDSILMVLAFSPVAWFFASPNAATDPTPFDFLLDLLFNLVLPAVAVILFWMARQATPGKMAIGAQIVDAQTGGKPSRGQLIGRYLGYYVSIFPLCLGLLWVAFDKRKQGWHDKLAGTLVVRKR